MSSQKRFIFLDSDYRYGFHVSKSPTLSATVQRVGKDLPFRNFQTYLGNPRSNSVSNCDVDDIASARELLEMYNLKMFIHGCLMYNLCGAPNHRKDPKFDYNLKNTSNGLTIELDIAAGLGCGGVVVHPNSCHDIEKGLFTASRTIETVLTKNTVESRHLAKKLGISHEKFKRKRKILLENSAHEGGKRGWNLEELGKMIKGFPKELQGQVGVCIDTAHAYGAGIYDFGKISDINKFYEDFEKEIGLEKLCLFHLNDSMNSLKKADNAYFGSHKDRHQNLGLGYIFGRKVTHPKEYSNGDGEIIWDPLRREALKEFFKQAYSRKIPIIGEPPSSSFGGIYDWETICEILKDTEFPLRKIETVGYDRTIKKEK